MAPLQRSRRVHAWRSRISCGTPKKAPPKSSLERNKAQKRNTKNTIQNETPKIKENLKTSKNLKASKRRSLTLQIEGHGEGNVAQEALMAAWRMISQYMEVVGSDGAHVGIVDRIEGADEIKLVKDDPDAGGQERYIPLTWLAHAEMKVHLNLPAAEAKARWSTH